MLKHLNSLLLLLVSICVLSAQSPGDVRALLQKVKDANALELFDDMPQDYKDYHLDWNGSTETWDSTNIDIGMFWGTPDMINVRIQTMARTESGLEAADWMETYNVNSDDFDPQDPLIGYTFFPGDSIHAVIDAPWFGIFPLSSYYTANGDNQLATEESFYNSHLLGKPGGIQYSLGGSHNLYDVNGRLTDYVVDWEGLDSTHFYYDTEGRIDYSVEMIAEFGSTPEEYILTNYEFDCEDRLISTVTTYYLDSLQTFDFKDSLVYKYNTGMGYDRESYYYDLDAMAYRQSGVVQHYFPEDTVEVVDIYQVSLSGTYLSQRTRTVSDEEGRFLYNVTQESFGTLDPLSNATKVVRVYDDGTLSSTSEHPVELNELMWQKLDRELNVWWDHSYFGALRLFSLDGRQIASALINGNTGTLSVPDLPAGIYYLSLTNDSGQVVGSASTYLE